jgi:hypothetical protein
MGMRRACSRPPVPASPLHPPPSLSFPLRTTKCTSSTLTALLNPSPTSACPVRCPLWRCSLHGLICLLQGTELLLQGPGLMGTGMKAQPAWCGLCWHRRRRILPGWVSAHLPLLHPAPPLTAANELNDVIAPSCYSCFDYTNATGEPCSFCPPQQWLAAAHCCALRAAVRQEVVGRVRSSSCFHSFGELCVSSLFPMHQCGPSPQLTWWWATWECRTKTPT